MLKLKPIPLLNFLSKWRLPLRIQVPRLGFWASAFTPSSQMLPRRVDPGPDLYTFLHPHHLHQPSPWDSSSALSTSRCVQSPPVTAQVVFLYLSSSVSHHDENWRLKPSAFHNLTSLLSTIHYPYTIQRACRFFSTHTRFLLPRSLLLCLKCRLSYIFCCYFFCSIYWGCHPCKGVFPPAPWHRPGLN